MARLPQVAQYLLARDGGNSDFFDFQAAGDIRQCEGGFVVRAGRERHAERAQHHVARAGDVVHLAGSRRYMLAPAIAVREEHAVLVQSYDGRL